MAKVKYAGAKKSQTMKPKSGPKTSSYVKQQISRSKKGESKQPSYLKTQTKRSGF
jgi:hypothetical protein